jgi:hypothetical protein
MTTSGLYSWNASETVIINRAARIVGVSQPTAADYANFRIALNSIIKDFVNYGSTLWKNEWRIDSISTLSSVLGSDGNSYYCINPIASATTAMAPVSGADYQSYFVKGGTSTTPISAGAAYTTSASFTYSDPSIVDVERVFIRDNETDYNLSKESYSSYFGIEDKTITSTIPTKFATKRSLDYFTLLFYPVPILSAQSKIHSFVLRQYADFSGTAQTADLPQEYIETLTYLLSAALSDEYHLPLDERSWLRNKSEKLKEQVLSRRFDSNSNTSVVGHWRY